MCYPRLLRVGWQGDNRLFPRYVRVVSDFRPLQLRVAAAMHDRKAGRSAVTYTIAEPCVDVMDKACIEECPVDCIYEGGRMLYIHPDECVDCGACEPVCPVEAIFYEDDVPDQWNAYISTNVDFFDDLGSPGGAAKLGKVDYDTPFIKALPPMGEE